MEKGVFSLKGSTEEGGSACRSGRDCRIFGNLRGGLHYSPSSIAWFVVYSSSIRVVLYCDCGNDCCFSCYYCRRSTLYHSLPACVVKIRSSGWGGKGSAAWIKKSGGDRGKRRGGDPFGDLVAREMAFFFGSRSCYCSCLSFRVYQLAVVGFRVLSFPNLLLLGEHNLV